MRPLFQLTGLKFGSLPVVLVVALELVLPTLRGILGASVAR